MAYPDGIYANELPKFQYKVPRCKVNLVLFDREGNEIASEKSLFPIQGIFGLIDSNVDTFGGSFFYSRLFIEPFFNGGDLD